MTILNTEHPIHTQIDTIRAVKVPNDVRRYYDGDHPPVATVDQQEALGDRAIRPYVENVIRKCVNAMAGRLLFRAFLCEDDAVRDELKVFASKNQYNSMMVMNTVRMLVDGNNAMSLSWSGGRPVVHQEDWWDGTDGMYVERSSDGIVEWAVKEWKDRGKVNRRTVYFPDHIERYAQDGEVWRPFPDDDTYIVDWQKKNGDPLGVPVVHFRNAVTSDSMYGTSSIESLLGMQDALNGTLFDIIAASAMNAFGIYTVAGVDIKKTRLSVGPGRLWAVEDKDVRFGVLNGSNMDGIMDGYQSIKSAIAGQFPVSEHLIGGSQWPSGLALQKVDGPMISQVKLIGDTAAPSHVQLAHRAVEMINAFTLADLDESALIQIEYEPPEQLDEGTMAEIDAERVKAFRDIADLPKTLMVKTGLVTSDEADAIIRERSGS